MSIEIHSEILDELAVTLRTHKGVILRKALALFDAAVKESTMGNRVVIITKE
jgi:hypothetical protein